MPNDSETQTHGFDRIDNWTRDLDNKRLPLDAKRLILRAIKIYTTETRTKIVSVIAEDLRFNDLWFFTGDTHERIPRDYTGDIRKKIDDNPSLSPAPIPEYIDIENRETMQQLAGALAELISEEDIPKNVSASELLLHEKVRYLFRENI